jgi:hypothetical protein
MAKSVKIPIGFRVKTDARFVFTPICFVWSSCFINVISIYLHILVSNTISMSDDVRALPTIPEHVSSPRWVRVARSLILCNVL